MYRNLLESRPDNPQLMHLLGVAVFQQNRAEEAATLIQRAIERDPKPAEYHNNLGIVLDALRRSEESEASYRRAISIKPDYAEAHNNLAGTLLALGRCDQAIDEYQTAITLKPDYAEAWDNYGSSLRFTNRNHDAMAAYDQALALQPSFAYAHYNRGTLFLAMGEFVRGWDDFEWRWRCSNFGHPDRKFEKPMWNGQDLSGKTILFHSEQGLGDTIHFVRYASVLAERSGRVIVEAQPALASLLTDVPGVSVSMSRGDALPDFDYHIPMMSVPRLARTTLETIPHETPYILPPAVAHENWRSITRHGCASRRKEKTARRAGLGGESGELCRWSSLDLSVDARTAGQSAKRALLQPSARGCGKTSRIVPIPHPGSHRQAHRFHANIRLAGQPRSGDLRRYGRGASGRRNECEGLDAHLRAAGLAMDVRSGG